MAANLLDAARSDVDELVALERACFSVPWTKGQIIAELPDRQHELLIARDEQGKLLGYVGMMTVLDEGYISNVAVREESRRQGVADALLAELLQRAATRELAFVTLEVRESNEAAQRLYEKHGFVRVGLRRGYYEAPRENAVLMTKYLK